MKKSLVVLASLMVMASCTVYQKHDATGNPIGTKVGVAKSKIFGSSEIGIRHAAKNGGITKIGSIDITTKIIIFPVTKVVVTGE